MGIPTASAFWRAYVSRSRIVYGNAKDRDSGDNFLCVCRVIMHVSSMHTSCPDLILATLYQLLDFVVCYVIPEDTRLRTR
jgi:hypothetical protein